MNLPSNPVTAAFVALCVGVALLGVAAVHRAGKRLGEPKKRTLLFTLCSAAFLMLWMGATYGAAASGLLRDFTAMPPEVVRVVAPGLALTFALAFSPLGTRLVRGLSLAALVGFQAFRIAVEALLFAFHREGALPVEMTFEGWNFDVASGVLALVLAWWISREGPRPRPVARRLVAAWNVLGLLLLATIVTIAVLAMPTTFQVLASTPPNRLVAEAPFVWLPTVLVPAALFGHLLVFRRLALWGARQV